jgi:hypothetical protein
VLCDWIARLSALGLDPGDGPASNALSAALAELKIDTSEILKCDPKFAAFLELLRKASENCGNRVEVAL